MKDTLTNIINASIGVMKNINNEIKNGLSKIESEINVLIQKGEQASDEKSIKIKQFVDKTITALIDYQTKAQELTGNVKNYIDELDMIGHKRIEELSSKIQNLSDKIKNHSKS